MSAARVCCWPKPLDGSHEGDVLQAAGFIPLIHQDVLKLAVGRDRADASRPDGLREQNLKDERDDALVYWLAQKVGAKTHPTRRDGHGAKPGVAYAALGVFAHARE